MDLRIINDWVLDEQGRASEQATSQKKVLELQLKVNSLVQENSLLVILNDKHKLVTEKYKQSFRLNTGTAPLRNLLQGCPDAEEVNDIDQLKQRNEMKETGVKGRREATMNIA